MGSTFLLVSVVCLVPVYDARQVSHQVVRRVHHKDIDYSVNHGYHRNYLPHNRKHLHTVPAASTLHSSYIPPHSAQYDPHYVPPSPIHQPFLPLHGPPSTP